MYERQAPDESLHLVVAFNSIHWMDHQPRPLSDGLVFQCSTDTEATQAWLQVKQRELETFLRLRSAELVPGGRIVVSWVETEEGGGGKFKAIHNVMNIMADDGWVSRETAKKACFPATLLPMATLLEPWEGIDGRPTTSGPLPLPAPHRELPLQLEAVWTEDTNPAQQHTETSDDDQEADDAHFDKLVSSVRGWTEGMVTSFMVDDHQEAGGHHDAADSVDGVAAKVEQFYVTLREELVRINGHKDAPLGIKNNVFVIKKI